MKMVKSYNSTNEILDEDTKPKVTRVTEYPYEYLESFEALDLPPPILRALRDDLKLDAPNRMQARTLPLITTKPYKHLVAQARLGSGKILCYALSMFQRIDLKLRQPQALVICPTVELATEINKVVTALDKHYHEVSVGLILPGHTVLHQNPHILIGLPSTIKSLILEQSTDLSNIKMVILEETDHMLEQVAVEEDDDDDNDDDYDDMARDIDFILKYTADAVHTGMCKRLKADIKWRHDLMKMLARFPTNLPNIQCHEDNGYTELVNLSKLESQQDKTSMDQTPDEYFKWRHDMMETLDRFSTNLPKNQCHEDNGNTELVNPSKLESQQDKASMYQTADEYIEWRHESMMKMLDLFSTDLPKNQCHEDNGNTELVNPSKLESQQDTTSEEAPMKSDAMDQTADEPSDMNHATTTYTRGILFQVLVFYSSLTDDLRNFIFDILQPKDMNLLFVNDEEKSVFSTRSYKFSPPDDMVQTKIYTLRCMLEFLGACDDDDSGIQAIVYVNPGTNMRMFKEKLQGEDVAISVPQSVLLKPKIDDENVLRFKLGKASILITSAHVFTPGGFHQSKVHGVIFYDIPMVLNVPDYVLYYRLATNASKGLEEGFVFHLVSPQHEGLMLNIEKHFRRTSKQLKSVDVEGVENDFIDAMNMEEDSFKFDFRFGSFKKAK